jgi:hypothetical protein
VIINCRGVWSLLIYPIENQAINERRHLDTYRSTREIQVAQMSALTVVSHFPRPSQAVRHCQAMKSLWRRKNGPPCFDRLVPLLSTWASLPKSSLLIVRGSLSTKKDTIGLVMDIFDSISAANAPVVWALKGNANIRAEHDATVLLLKYLVQQILQLNSNIVDSISTSFNAAVLQAASTEGDWFKILHTVISGLREIYVIIDAELLRLEDSSSHWSTYFIQKLQDFIRTTTGTVLKVVIFSYRQLEEPRKLALAKDVMVGDIKKLMLSGKKQLPVAQARGGQRSLSRGGRGGPIRPFARSIAIRRAVD